jgi:hypothetical protein
MFFGKILAVLLLPLQIVLQLYRDWKHYDRRTRKYKRLTIAQISIVFVAIAILGMTLYLDSKNEERQLELISDLRDKVASLNTNLEPLQKIAENTQETYFTVSEKKERRIEDGSYEVSFVLEPVGEKIIPLFKIQCKTQDNVQIENIEVEDSTIPPISYDRKSDDRTYFSKEYRSLEPGKVEVTILTSDIPIGMTIAIDPFRKEEKGNGS